MDRTEYLELNSRENAKIYEFMIELKEEKLYPFYFDLINNAQWEYILQLLDDKIPFYEGTDTTKVLNKAITDISSSLSWCEEHIENIFNINDEKYMFIKEKLIKCVVKNLIERQEIPMVRRDLFDHINIKLAEKLLLENQRYVDLYEHVNVPEIKQLYHRVKHVVTLENKLPLKDIHIKKPKI